MKSIKEGRQKVINDNQKLREEMESQMLKKKEEKLIDDAEKFNRKRIIRNQILFARER